MIIIHHNNLFLLTRCIYNPLIPNADLSRTGLQRRHLEFSVNNLTKTDNYYRLRERYL